jgi:hypothetical protein
MVNGNGPAATRAFISYAHDNDAHRELVRGFWHFLREYGIAASCDFEFEGERQEWPRVIESAMNQGEFILVVASPEYVRRASRPPGYPGGRGVEYEAALLRERIYRDRPGWFSRILPVVLPGRSRQELPEFLLPESATVYFVRDFTVPGAEELLRNLTRQPSEIQPPLGSVPELRPRPAPRDERGRVLDELVDLLATLPAIQTVEARAGFLEMITERTGWRVSITGPAFARELVAELAEHEGGLQALAETVRAFHRSELIERDVRRLVERFTMIS